MNVVFSSISAPFFSEYLANIAKGKFVKWQKVPSYRKPNTCLFLVGLYVPEHSFYDRISHFEKIIILFAGSDILRLNKMKEKSRNKLFDRLKRAGAIFATESCEIQDKIKDIYGMDTTIIHLPSKHKFSETPYPMPEKFSVGCYMPCNNSKGTSRRFFYGFKKIVEVVRRMPEVDFYFYYNGGGYEPWADELGMKNFIGCKEAISDMPSFLKDISCGLRIAEHDTYSMSAIEYNMAGRWFINNHPMPQCEKLPHSPSVDEIVNLIREVKDRQGYNVEGKKCYDDCHSWNNFNKTINKLL